MSREILCPAHSGVVERVGDLEDRLDRHEEKQNSSLDKVWKELFALRKEFSGRPTWGAALLITTLVGAVVGLVMAIIKL
ncbi:MAG TPA: hypothetical protein VGL40_06920 [Bacillota bacterium]